MPLTVPTIHLNGTSAASLLNDVQEAHLAVHSALEALAHAAPNARDYYVQGPHAYTMATLEHDARMAKLREVRDELEKIAEHIVAQDTARRGA